MLDLFYNVDFKQVAWFAYCCASALSCRGTEGYVVLGSAKLTGPNPGSSIDKCLHKSNIRHGMRNNNSKQYVDLSIYGDTLRGKYVC